VSGRARAFVWGFTPSSHAFAVTREDRRLVVMVSELPDGALTVAIESPRTADTEGLLAGRRVLAERTTLATGKRRGERFARAWLAGAPSARCPAANVGLNGKKRPGSR
jgi:hypothetical protein